MRGRSASEKVDVVKFVANLRDMSETTREWATTRSKYCHDDDPPTPVPPDGTGWRLVGMVHVEGRYDTAIVFAWERDL
jgi:hypothetical protein